SAGATRLLFSPHVRDKFRGENMKKHQGLATGAFVGCLLVCAGATAQENPMYFGVKAGQVDSSRGGYDLHRDANGAFAIEGEYTHDISQGDVSVSGVNGRWKIETLAAYGAYRTGGDVYLKAKAGWLSEDINVSGTGGGKKDSDFSYGAGVGFHFNRKTGLELEYTVLENDFNFLSIGYFTHF